MCFTSKTMMLSSDAVPSASIAGKAIDPSIRPQENLDMNSGTQTGFSARSAWLHTQQKLKPVEGHGRPARPAWRPFSSQAIHGTMRGMSGSNKKDSSFGGRGSFGGGGTGFGVVLILSRWPRALWQGSWHKAAGNRRPDASKM